MRDGRTLDRHGVVAEVRHHEVAQQQPTVGVRVGAHPPGPVGAKARSSGRSRPVVVEELLGAVAAHPLLELRAVLGVGAGLGQRHLMGAEGPLDREPVDHLRAGPALRRAQHDHRPGAVRTPPAPEPLRASGLDDRDVVEHASSVAASSWCTVDRVVAGDEVRLVAVAAHQRRPARPRGSGPARWGWRSCSR